jgi:oligopeptide/dipeptide ABC transporter ATP-binding protein
MLEVRDLTVEIATSRGILTPVDSVSLEIARGATLGLVGESGSGKSMTLRAILGLLPRSAKVTGGSVLLDGVELTKLSPTGLDRVRGRKVSMIFQEPMTALNPVVRVGTQIGEGPIVHGNMTKAQAKERAIELMRMVGIPDPQRRYRAYPHELSGGMRQRVMIAIAMSCEPELILCDEPTTALDVTIQDQILKLLLHLCSTQGVSLLFVTHDLAVVAQTCDSVAVMYAGRICEQGTVAEVFTEPHHPYTLGLLRSAPDIDDVREELVAIPGNPPSILSPPPGCRFHPRCSFVQEDCKVGEMVLRPVDAGGRLTACLHHELCAAPVVAGPVADSA